jgi:hypothetical protein
VKTINIDAIIDNNSAQIALVPYDLFFHIDKGNIQPIKIKNLKYCVKLCDMLEELYNINSHDRNTLNNYKIMFSRIINSLRNK